MPDISVSRFRGVDMPAVMAQALREGRSMTAAAPQRQCGGQESASVQSFASIAEMIDSCDHTVMARRVERLACHSLGWLVSHGIDQRIFPYAP
jgi:hypothetical protein